MKGVIIMKLLSIIFIFFLFIGCGAVTQSQPDSLDQTLQNISPSDVTDQFNDAVLEIIGRIQYMEYQIAYFTDLLNQWEIIDLDDLDADELEIKNENVRLLYEILELLYSEIINQRGFLRELENNAP